MKVLFIFHIEKMKDVFRNILPQHLGFKDYLNFGLSCKEYYEMTDIPKKRKETQAKIQELFPENIIQMIGKQRFLNACEVKWNPKWLGGTDYIDNARAKDFTGDKNSIYYGIDAYQRPFIFLKIRRINSEGVHRETILSIFQRYTDNKMFVNIDNSSTSEILVQGKTVIDDNLSQKFCTFINDGRFELNGTTLEIFY